jgi:hypothetical protein
MAHFKCGPCHSRLWRDGDADAQTDAEPIRDAIARNDAPAADTV